MTLIGVLLLSPSRLTVWHCLGDKKIKNSYLETAVWFLIDDSGLIAQYDIVFRRFGWTFDYVKPFLRPQLVKELGPLADGCKDDDDLMHLRAAIDVCQAHETYCHGADQQYESTQACVDYIRQKVPFGKVYEWGGDTGKLLVLTLVTLSAHENTAMCRYIHTGDTRSGHQGSLSVLNIPQA